VPTVKSFVGAALSTVTTLGIVGLLTTGGTPAASATTPSWKTTASYSPLPNVRAVSCAAGATTCVAVGDDGGNYASILVSNNGGSTWSLGTVPSGVTALATVSCPSATICYAGGGSGILKSSNGGASWMVQDSAFSPQSISCFTADQCSAVGGLQIVATTDGSTWTFQTAPTQTNSLNGISCPNQAQCFAIGWLIRNHQLLANPTGWLGRF
jgi:photosystem II stability/assembly factor-like uncharacterized protein